MSRDEPALAARVRRIESPRVLDAFLVINYAFLAPDIFLAHSINEFHHWAEWIPFYFSLAAPVILLAGLAVRTRAPAADRAAAFSVGWVAVAVGVAGLLLHLSSRFFVTQTLQSLVYTAPFVAPLAYAGLGLLTIMNRMVSEPREWSQWVLILANGGFIGNFVLSLADHAQNGFFEWTEWIPVISAALAVGFLIPAALPDVHRDYLKMCAWIMALQAAVGVLGFAFHGYADLTGQMSTLRDNFIFGAPIFAPLLFPNLALLAGIGLWGMARAGARRTSETPARAKPHSAT